MDDFLSARREYAQLLRFHDRLTVQLRRIRDELEAPSTGALVREISRRTGDAPGEPITDVLTSVEEALRALKLATSTAHLALLDQDPAPVVSEVPNLPPRLARFLAERAESPEFHYEVIQDEVRGWVIRWKERSGDGSVRGFGQFYERPYAWLDE